MYCSTQMSKWRATTHDPGMGGLRHPVKWIQLAMQLKTTLKDRAAQDDPERPRRKHKTAETAAAVVAEAVENE